ncbi:MAG TPA: zinc-binding dehydrogenase [Chloroflexota bacterium]
MDKMRAAVVDGGATGHLAIREVDVPTPLSNQALIRLAATSLNLGEVHRAQSAQDGTLLGWDVAGTVERAAADGSGPAAGTRVVGLLRSGAWAELAAVPTDSLAALPEGVSFAQVATLPVAGLTALLAVEHVGGLLARRVLVTGASGGVGHFACRLAKLSGAHVVGLIRRQEKAGLVRESGADEVIVGEDASPAAGSGPYRLVVEAVGGKVLAQAAGMLGPDGACVSIGVIGGTEIVLDLRSMTAPRSSLYKMLVFNEVARETAAVGLSRLAQLVADGRLKPHIDAEEGWERIGQTAADLLQRKISGKAVLTIR